MREEYNTFIVMLFFISALVIGGVVMLNLLTVVLFERYITALESEESFVLQKFFPDKEEKGKDGKKKKKTDGVNAMDEAHGRINRHIDRLEALVMPTTQRSVEWLRHAKHEAVFSDRSALFEAWKKTQGLPKQAAVANFYDQTATQIFVGFLILLNFVISALKAEVKPEEGSLPEMWFSRLEYVFTFIFLIELFLN